ncbi:hypothetical protein BT69DRAFT_1333843 [Atractiella rhizophila]|nr:hypothetical protein BT69DRAFT_1333843 [Atractiella rhizophila]
MASAPPFDAAGVLGPWLVGALASSALGGLVMTQSFGYYIRYPKDRLVYKLLVLALSVGSITAWALNIALVWFYCITTRNDNSLLAHPPSYQRPLTLFPVWCIFFSQCYFAHRCWLFLQRSILVGVVLAVLILASLATGLADFIIFQKLFIGIGQTLNAHIVDQVQVVLELNLWVVAASDLLISGILAYKLRASKGNFNNATDSLLLRLIQMAMTTAAFTALISISDAVVFAVTSLSSNAHLALYVLHPHTYALTTIFSLNTRKSLKEELDASRTPVSGNNITDQGTPKATFKLTNLSRPGGGPTDGVRVHVTTFMEEDVEKNHSEKYPREDVDQAYAV